MLYGISGTALPAGFPYKTIIEQQCFENNCPPCLVGAIKLNETGLNQDDTELQDGCNAATMLLPDGTNCGRGPMQLTSSWPSDWQDPAASFRYAIQEFINPAIAAFAALGVTGPALVKCAAAAYNEGLGTAELAHAEGYVDKYDTDDYGLRAEQSYTALIAGTIPQ
jgi:hypothetical protein